MGNHATFGLILLIFERNPTFFIGCFHAGLVSDSSVDSDRAFAARVWAPVSALARHAHIALVSGLCVRRHPDGPPPSGGSLGPQRWESSLARGGRTGMCAA